ncbi:amidohydrolase family protein [Nocardia sp. alder85J]|uniref:amidohydrolase family protein n=1 Tax=Nocardia sp. alder85J TaxID=2862949 RepID=UPI001CD8137D|nr:amidohydrolase family protein [Nocardia sp. alder85J]MCX4091589.1 amidohydrolase family protein [Nocardia sp. alder85J]
MAELPFRYFDCDNHYYEALDAFTRYLEPEYRKRGIQWAEIDGKTRLLVAGKVNKFIPNPTFDPVAAPGVMDEYFRGRNPKSADPRQLFGQLEPIRPEYRDRDARLALMDRQGMDGAIFLPTLGVGMEQYLTHDIPALTATFRAFNRWLDEDWGFAYRERIFAAPYITLSDPAGAVRELEWVLERDARFVVMVGGPVHTAVGDRAPGDPMFDGFWQLADDSGITVIYHGGETAYTRIQSYWGENDFTEAFRANAFRGLSSPDPIHDTIASHLALGLFHRFPNLRIASIELGSAWVFHLFEKLTKSYGQVPHLYPEDPRETFRKHLFVSPYYEDELAGLLKLVGVDRILMGSDYPHVEGLADPSTYIKDLENFDYTAEQCRAVMRDNGLALTVRRPVR